MNLIKNMNIKSKLGILFSILCISIAILAYKAVNISEDNIETLKVVHSKSQAILSLQNKIITPLYSLRQLNQSLVMAPNKEIRKEIEKDLNKIIEKLDIDFENVKVYSPMLFEMWQSYKEHIFKQKNI